MDFDRNTILFIFILVVLLILFVWLVCNDNGGTCKPPPPPTSPPAKPSGGDDDSPIENADEGLDKLHFIQMPGDGVEAFVTDDDYVDRSEDQYTHDEYCDDHRSPYSPRSYNETPSPGQYEYSSCDDHDYVSSEPPATGRGKSPYERRHYNPS